MVLFGWFRLQFTHSSGIVTPRFSAALLSPSSRFALGLCNTDAWELVAWRWRDAVGMFGSQPDVPLYLAPLQRLTGSYARHRRDSGALHIRSETRSRRAVPRITKHPRISGKRVSQFGTPVQEHGRGVCTISPGFRYSQTVSHEEVNFGIARCKVTGPCGRSAS